MSEGEKAMIKYTEMGTRILIPKVSGGSVKIMNDEEGRVFIDVRDEERKNLVFLDLDAHEALSLAEFLITGAKPNPAPPAPASL